MSTTPQYAGPAIDPSVPFEIRLHLTQIYQKLGNHNQGFGLLNDKIAKIQSGTTVTQVISGGAGGGGVTPSIPSGLGFINDQTGNTSYTTTSGDNGVLLILNDASPVAVSLSTLAAPFLIFITNSGATTTLTPSSGTINGAASLDLLQGEWTLAECDGTNWKTTAIVAPGTEPYRSITAPTTITAADYQIEVTSGTFTQPLPTATGIQGKTYSIKNSGTGVITISTTGGQLIDGETTQPLSPESNIMVMSNGTGWLIV